MSKVWRYWTVASCIFHNSSHWKNRFSGGVVWNRTRYKLNYKVLYNVPEELSDWPNEEFTNNEHITVMLSLFTGYYICYNFSTTW